MFTATIYTGEKSFKACVDYGKESVHPDSTHFVEGCLTDERIPPDLILKCNMKGAVSVSSGRPGIVPPGKQVKARVAATKDAFKKWAVAKIPQGEEVIWFENWAYIPCNTKAHCEHIIDLLKQEIVPKGISPVTV